MSINESDRKAAEDYVNKRYWDVKSMGQERIDMDRKMGVEDVLYGISHERKRVAEDWLEEIKKWHTAWTIRTGYYSPTASNLIDHMEKWSHERKRVAELKGAEEMAKI